MENGLSELFFENLESVLAKSGSKFSPEAQAYLYLLMSSCVSSSCYNPSLVVTDVLVKISQSSNDAERLSLYLEIGDFSLFSAGFFIENLMRRGVSLEYYLQVGASSYSSAYHICGNPALLELSGRYSDAAIVLGQVSDRIFLNKMQKTMNIFDSYRNNKSSFLRRRLASLGFVVAEDFND